MSELDGLKTLLDSAAEGLPKVSAKKMFGCHALFADDKIFALVWKENRIGVKLLEEASYAELMETSGSAPWSPGAMKVTRWVLVPKSWHKKPAQLGKWVAQAHGQCLMAEKKPAKKPAAKKVAKKKGAAKKKTLKRG